MDIGRFNNDVHVMKIMTKETTKKITLVDKMTKEQMAETIKTVKREAESSEKKDTISICDIMKNNTAKIIREMESQVPTYTQLYSDLYTKYLHVIDDLYSTCYVSEKEFFGKLGMDKTTLGAFDAYWKFITDMTISQIELTTDFAKMYVQFRLSALDSYDKVVHLMMDSYAKAWIQFNSYNKK